MSTHEFAASGKILIDATGQKGGNADFGMSGIVTVPDYSSNSIFTGRQWIDGDDVYEVVVSGLPPAPGQTVYLYGLFNASYFNIVEASIWLVDKNGRELSVPIPCHDPSGVGTWMMKKEGSLGSAVYISASSDAQDFLTGQNGRYVVWGVVRYINI